MRIDLLTFDNVYLLVGLCENMNAKSWSAAVPIETESASTEASGTFVREGLY